MEKWNQIKFTVQEQMIIIIITDEVDPGFYPLFISLMVSSTKEIEIGILSAETNEK